MAFGRRRFRRPVQGEPVKKSLNWLSHVVTQQGGSPTLVQGNTLATTVSGQSFTGTQWCFVVDEATDPGTYGRCIIKIKAVPIGFATGKDKWCVVAYRLLAIPKGESVQSIATSLSTETQDSSIGFGVDTQTSKPAKCKGLMDLYPTTDTVLWSASNGVVQFDPQAPAVFYVEDRPSTKRKAKKGARIVLVLGQTTNDVRIQYTAEIISFQKTN